MNRIIFFLAMLILGLTACKKESKQTQQPTNTPDTTTAMDKLVGMYVGNHSHRYYAKYTDVSHGYEYTKSYDTTYYYPDTVKIIKIDKNWFRLGFSLLKWQLSDSVTLFHLDTNAQYYKNHRYWATVTEDIRIDFKGSPDSIFIGTLWSQDIPIGYDYHFDSLKAKKVY